MQYLLKHGVANLSLRPLARAAGTSARMLVHHFGSKEKLIIAVMNELRSRFQSTFDALAREAENGQSADLMLMFWRSITERENLKYIRLLFEVQVLAIQNPRRYQRYLADTSSSWLRLIGRELRKDKERIAISTLSAAVIDGLTLELLSTGDLPRTSQALRVFIARFHGQASPRSQKNSKKR